MIPKGHFIAADILDQNDGGLKELEGKTRCTGCDAFDSRLQH